MRGLAVALALTLLTGAAAAADPETVQTRGGLHSAYGRLVFDWKSKVGYQAEVQGDQLEVTFDRPFISSLAAAEKRLAGYIGKGEISADGRTVTFPLRRPVSPKAFVVNDSVVVDLYRSSEPGPVWGKRTPPDAPAVKVRAGEHPTHTRFVFDWPESVKYEISGRGGDTLLAFGKPANLDTDGLTKKFVRLLDDGGKDASDIVSAVRFNVPAGRQVRHFRLGNRIVVDLVKQPKGAPVVAERAGGNADPAPAAEVATDDTKAPPVEPRHERAAIEPEVKELRADPKRQAPEAETAAGGPATAQPAIASGSPQPAEPAVNPPVKPVQLHRPTGTAHAEETAPSAAAARLRLLQLVRQAEASEAKDATAPASKQPAIEVGYAGDGDSYSLSFPGLADAKATVFSRAGGAWIVFDRPVDLRFGGVAAKAPELARAATVLGHPSATVLRIEEAVEHALSVRRDGTAWVVDFGRSDRPPYRPLVVEVEPESTEAGGLVIPVERPGEPVALVDPEAGDRLLVVPLPVPDTGLAEAQEYPQVQLLATAQGVAAAQRGDGLVVSSDEGRIRITTGAGLLLSRLSAAPAPQLVEGGAPVAASSGHDGPRLLDLAHWQRPQESFSQARRKLERAALEAGPEAVDAARLDLVRFYLARGLAAEALGALEAAGPEAAATMERPVLHAVRGAANLLAHRPEAAKADLFHPELDAYPEAAVWRGAWHALQGNWQAADGHFAEAWPVVADYPKWLRQELGLRAAEAALEQGESDRAAGYLTASAEDDAPQAVQSRAKFLRGRVLAERGEAADALAVWNEVRDSADQVAHARAELAAVKLGLEEGLISHEEAIERLERLRFAWRGDAREFETLNLLGRAYLAAGDYWNGFGTLRDAVTLFSERVDTAPATELMTSEFRRLFVDGAMRELPPLKAVSLYQEYRELTPIGEEGERVIRDLAGRLVGLDLLEPAADLLDNQVRYRLEGERRARSAADLALIHLLDRNPQKAVEILRMSEMSGLPEDLAAQRRHLLARGLWDLGETGEALRAIASDGSREAEALRADIYWKAGRWADAAGAYARIASRFGAGELSPADSRVILKWGVALTLARDTAAVREVGAKYAGAMAGTSYEPAFRMITAGRPASGASLATITETLAEVDDFQAYLKSYRNALEKSAAVAGTESGGTS